MSVAPLFAGDSPDRLGLPKRWGWLRTPGRTQSSIEHIRPRGRSRSGPGSGRTRPALDAGFFIARGFGPKLKTRSAGSGDVPIGSW